MDTIVALASARGRSGVAVIRVSGDEAWAVCKCLAGRVPEPRVATLLTLRDGGGEMLDTALVLVFEAGHSFTGERVCEFQVHGSIAVTSAVIRACLAVPGVRAAEPGEFTQRAFFAGRMNLVEVEALADLIDAETEAQRRQALRVLEGSPSRLIEEWRNDLLQAKAMLEAVLDFADEDLPGDLASAVIAPIKRVRLSIAEQLEGRKAVEAIREGFEVAIIGRVNAGKSTLLNVLAGREAAITSERAGTTRDVIEVRMEIGGFPVTLLDTAGLRKAEDEIEAIGIERGMRRAESADLRVYLKSEPDEVATQVVSDDIVVLSKCDLWGVRGLSARTGEGVTDLLAAINDRLSARTLESSAFCRERHFDNLAKARASLQRAETDLLGSLTGLEIVSAELQVTQRCLDGIIGRSDVEDVLGRIFSSFCIGK